MNNINIFFISKFIFKDFFLLQMNDEKSNYFNSFINSLSSLLYIINNDD